jgi:hypothetical protein
MIDRRQRTGCKHAGRAACAARPGPRRRPGADFPAGLRRHPGLPAAAAGRPTRPTRTRKVS